MKFEAFECMDCEGVTLLDTSKKLSWIHWEIDVLCPYCQGANQTLFPINFRLGPSDSIELVRGSDEL